MLYSGATAEPFNYRSAAGAHMETQLQKTGEATSPWVLLGSVKDGANPADADRLAGAVRSIIDDWHAAGRIMWSGALDNGKSGMAVFEATPGDARALFERYRDACGGSLDCFLYAWDAMPILSLLSDQRGAAQA